MSKKVVGNETFVGKLIKNDMQKEGTGAKTWKLYELVLLMEDSTNKKFGSFNKNYNEFMDKYVAVECEIVENVGDDNKVYNNYEIKSIKEMTADEAKKAEENKPVKNKSPRDYQKEKAKEDKEDVDWDAKERRKHIENALTRATGIIQVGKDLGLITKENTKDMKALIQKWLALTNVAIKKIYQPEDEMGNELFSEELPENKPKEQPEEEVVS